MLKWIFALLIIGITGSILVTHRIQPGTEPDKVPESVSDLSLSTQDINQRRFVGSRGAVDSQKGRLTVNDERLSKRVAPKKEAPLKADVLPQ